MARIIFSVLLFLGFYYVYAQSEPQFSQYMHHKYLFNPGHAGSADNLEVSVLHRSQYVGLSSKVISTQAVNFNIPFDIITSGVGITAINDLIGFERATYVALDYCFRKKFRWGKMGICISGGIIQTSLDGSRLKASDGSYDNGNINHNDSRLPENLQQGVSSDVSFGLYFNNEKYFAGASINHVAFSSVSMASSRLNFSRNLFFMGGYDFEIASHKLHIIPSLLVKSDLKRTQMDISATFDIIDKVLVGISFRGYTKNMLDALVVMGGFRVKSFQIIYSYDANLSYLYKFNTGSHEISIRYFYTLKKKEGGGYVYHNPRFR
jgi:type IX secretion system PorP/SprF family membrane protein